MLLKVDHGISRATNLPIVTWTQQRTYSRKLTFMEKMNWSQPPKHPEYGVRFLGYEFVTEEITAAILLENSPGGGTEMKLARELTPGEQAELSDPPPALAVPIQEIQGFMLTEPPQAITPYQTRPSVSHPHEATIHMDLGGGEKLYMAAHFDLGARQMPMLRRIFQEMFIEHDSVRRWLAERYGRAAPPTAAPTPARATGYDPRQTTWGLGSGIKITMKDGPDDVV